MGQKRSNFSFFPQFYSKKWPKKNPAPSVGFFWLGSKNVFFSPVYRKMAAHRFSHGGPFFRLIVADAPIWKATCLTRLSFPTILDSLVSPTQTMLNESCVSWTWGGGSFNISPVLGVSINKSVIFPGSGGFCVHIFSGNPGSAKRFF